MKPETTEWIEKAEGDWTVAQREMRTANPVWNVVSFLAQQCAEKYLTIPPNVLARADRVIK